MPPMLGMPPGTDPGNTPTLAWASWMLTTSFCIFCVADLRIFASCCSLISADADFLTCSPSRSSTHLSMVTIDSPEVRIIS